MHCRIAQFVRLLVLAAVTGLCPTSGDPGIITLPDSDATCEVRLRKLHLVRPDLIPFPISFEVYA